MTTTPAEAVGTPAQPTLPARGSAGAAVTRHFARRIRRGTRTRALATWTAVGIAGGTAGNLVGGVLTEYLSWRSILLINVPIGAVALVLAAHFLTSDHRDASRGRLDIAGAVLATTGLAALTCGIAQARAYGWGAPVTTVALAAGAVAPWAACQCSPSALS